MLIVTSDNEQLWRSIQQRFNGVREDIASRIPTGAYFTLFMMGFVRDDCDQPHR